jgi:hypothetical protein
MFADFSLPEGECPLKAVNIDGCLFVIIKRCKPSFG